MNEQRRKRLRREDSDAVEALLDLNGTPTEVKLDTRENFDDESATDENLPRNIVRSTRQVVEGANGEVVSIKGAWSPEEDAQMLEAVNKFQMDWKKVAKAITGRTAKQCRDRYRLKLDPSINHGPWTAEEDEKLLELFHQKGRHWTKIAKCLPGRTENAVKSRYSSLFRSRTKEWREDEERMLESLHAQGFSFDQIARDHLPHRSEHAVRKRWEKLYMQRIAKQIKRQIPNLEPSSSTQEGNLKSSDVPRLNPALAASTQSSVSRQEVSESSSTDENKSIASPVPSMNLMALNQNLAVNYLVSQSNPLALRSERKKLNRTITAASNFSTLSGISLIGKATEVVTSNPASVPSQPNPEPESKVEKEIVMDQTKRSDLNPIQRVKSRAGRLQRHSTSMTVMMQVLGEPVNLSGVTRI